VKDFGDEIKINRFKLEEECERHVSLYHYYSSERAKAKADLDEANDKLKLTTAEADQTIRTNWNEDKNGKKTEGAISNMIETDEEIIELKENIRAVQKNLYILEAATYALDHRKSMLDNLVTLLVKGFYSAPNGGRKEGVSEQVQSEVRKGLNKKGK